ncbi:HlyD family efflux transporter periplasmic adaptor subunit [Fulvivirga sp. RKSG066]|uniref:HlyD family secretion protein n=1 Tax=Fulvivirga aurantia TaxID=2529383 RepID=UPI0012BC326C|nr:HlyD family efflux transporter periplasmic adaptor subunit [Fulvivirga aurantia]MTI22796.1 HlyD family efflux transporter periplasmic adaptor subunit [Fulvivirga aurantia]
MENFKDQLEEDQLYTLKSLKTPSASKVLARSLMTMGAVFILASFLPWQQNIRGTGKLTAFSPKNRPQSVETAIAGRISKWYATEGQLINEGDTILALTEIKDKYFDPNLLLRLQEQINAKENSIQSKQAKAQALREQIKALNSAMSVKLAQARNKLSQAEYKLVSDSVDYESEKVRFNNFENQYDRNKKLFEAGNIALTKFQDIESKYQEARMKVVSAENKLLQSRAALVNARVDISGTEAEYQDKINKAESNLNATLSELYDAEASLSKLRNEFANMEIRNNQYQIIAPQTGYLVKAIKAGIGETIKEGEAVASIMPENPDKAVELYVNAMDVPLITPGREVRLEFDGWPALQFSGWPSVSVGTFAGRVKVIDRVDSKNGKFRMLVVPDESEEPWPDQLRLGSGAKGWVMLDSVPLWYEIWRQLNGFPPSLYEEPEAEEEEEKAKEK